MYGTCNRLSIHHKPPKICLLQARAENKLTSVRKEIDKVMEKKNQYFSHKIDILNQTEASITTLKEMMAKNLILLDVIFAMGRMCVVF